MGWWNQAVLRPAADLAVEIRERLSKMHARSLAQGVRRAAEAIEAAHREKLSECYCLPFPGYVVKEIEEYGYEVKRIPGEGGDPGSHRIRWSPKRVLYVPPQKEDS